MAGFGEAEARAARDNKLAQIANELVLLPPDEQARAMDAALAELGGAEDAAAFFAPTLDYSGGQGGPAVSAGSSTAQTTSGGGASAQSATSTVLWLLPDNLGTTRDVIDNSGALVNHIAYAAFGAITAITGASGQPLTQSATRYLYTQREFDFATHLNYHRARYYDPTSGRWLSEDPISFSAGDTNLQRYVANGPSNASDPNGLISKRRQPAIGDLNPRRMGDVEIAAAAVEVIQEMKEEKWKPRNPSNPGEFGDAFEERLAGKIDRRKLGNNQFFHDVCVDTRTRKILKLGGGPGGTDTTQIDFIYYRGELTVGAKLDRSKVIAVYDAKTGRIDLEQMERISQVTGKSVIPIEPPEKHTSRGWQASEKVAERLKRLKIAGIITSTALTGLGLLAVTMTDDEEYELALLVRRRNEVIDETTLLTWCQTDLRTWLARFIDDETTVQAAVLSVHHIEAELMKQKDRGN
jgi:RHS repeat-associated protein